MLNASLFVEIRNLVPAALLLSVGGSVNDAEPNITRRAGLGGVEMVSVVQINEMQVGPIDAHPDLLHNPRRWRSRQRRRGDAREMQEDQRTNHRAPDPDRNDGQR